MSDTDTAWIIWSRPATCAGSTSTSPASRSRSSSASTGSRARSRSRDENPLGPAPRALAAAHAALATAHLYPDASGFALRRALGERLGVAPAQLILGGGSNERPHELVAAFCEPDDEVASHAFAFLSYRLAAQVAARTFVAAPATADRRCDVDALIAAFTPRTKIVFIGTPNNPTGSVAPRRRCSASPTRCRRARCW